MQQENPGPQNNPKPQEKPMSESNSTSEQVDPESDTQADVTPRNIDPSDENSAEPDIIETTPPCGHPS